MRASPGNRVQVWNPATGSFVRDFGPSSQLSLPVGLTFGPDGRLYVSDFSSSSVLRYNSETGEFIDTFANLVAQPSNIEFGPDGLLYVSTFGSGARIDRYNGTTGAFVDTFIPAGGELNAPRGFIFIPEPTGAALVVPAALTLLRRRRHRVRR